MEFYGRIEEHRVWGIGYWIMEFGRQDWVMET